jgi:hypothetical protein
MKFANLRRSFFGVKKNYARLQKSSKSTLREYYEEVVYFLHQPSSINLRLAFCFGMVHWLSTLVLSYQQYYAQVYKRKRMRIMELQNKHMPPMGRKEFELVNKGARDNILR